jgi:hypothetical protein
MLTDRVAAIAAPNVPAALMISATSEPLYSSEVLEIDLRATDRDKSIPT